MGVHVDPDRVAGAATATSDEGRSGKRGPDDLCEVVTPTKRVKLELEAVSPVKGAWMGRHVRGKTSFDVPSALSAEQHERIEQLMAKHAVVSSNADHVQIAAQGNPDGAHYGQTAFPFCTFCWAAKHWTA